jgi:hypothetical protein
MRFSIRDVLWLMVVVGLGLGWLATAQRMSLLEARCQALDKENKVLAKDHKALKDKFNRVLGGLQVPLSNQDTASP